MREYNRRPEVKARYKAYAQLPWRKEDARERQRKRRTLPGVVKYRRKYSKEYEKRPYVMEKKRANARMYYLAGRRQTLDELIHLLREAGGSKTLNDLRYRGGLAAGIKCGVLECYGTTVRLVRSARLMAFDGFYVEKEAEVFGGRVNKDENDHEKE